MLMISPVLLKRLRVGDRPGYGQVDGEALLEAADVYGFVPDSRAHDIHNKVIDRLDQEHPGWRGYAVPETEGARNA